MTSEEHNTIITSFGENIASKENIYMDKLEIQLADYGT